MFKIKQNRSYKDLDFSFAKHPTSGDVAVKNDIAAIKQSIRNLVLTKKRPFHPEFKSGVYDLLFGQASLMSQIALQDEIKKILEQFEPRINVLDVTVRFSLNHSAEISVDFVVINTQDTVNFQFIVERIR